MDKIAVLGIGNILLKDDGLGVEALWRLEREEWPESVTLVDAGTAIMNLGWVFAEYDRIVVLDALRGGHPPGTIYRLTPEELGTRQESNLSLHEVNVLDMLRMAALGGHHPQTLILGMEPEKVELSMGLSTLISDRLPVFVDHIRAELAALTGQKDEKSA